MDILVIRVFIIHIKIKITNLEINLGPALVSLHTTIYTSYNNGYMSWSVSWEYCDGVCGGGGGRKSFLFICHEYLLLLYYQSFILLFGEN